MKPTSPQPELQSMNADDTGDPGASTNASGAAPARADRLADLLVRWEEAAARGQKLTPEDLCHDCPDLLADFRELLQDLKPVDAVLQIEQATTIDGQPNFTAGRYKPVRFHAAGGLGQVFVAEDTELSRTVALKQLKVFHQSDVDARNRFVMEAEITGRLEHPGVVPVYGLGIDNEGRPFYAMRFLSGHTFKEAIQSFHANGKTALRDQSVEFRRLLRHWIAACETVAFAHGHRVIHRDLKPANIMFGKYGETWVVDWGLAKTIGDPELPEPAHSGETGLFGSQTRVRIDHSITGEVKGTPMYMAPEQAEGQTRDLGPAADIYSLGAVLCELLSGSKPFAGNTSMEVIEQVRQGAMVPPRAANPLVPKPLDAVVRKAMALKPGDRYADAQALAADVERWLADEPVSAYRESFFERSRRWLRRHRTVVSTAVGLLAVITVLLAVGILVVAHQRNQTEKARKNEEKERLTAQREHHRARGALDRATDTVVSDFLARQVGELSPSQKNFLRDLVRDYREFAQQPGEDEETRARTAAAFLRAGRIQYRIGETEPAREAMEQAIQRYDQLAADFPDRPQYSAAAGAVHNHLCVLHRRRSDTQRAEAEALTAAAIFSKLVERYPDNLTYRLEWLQSLANVGVAASDAGRFDDAERTFRQVLAEHDQLRPRMRQDINFLMEEERNLANLSVAVERLGRLTEALSLIEEAIRRRQALVKLEPDAADHRHQLALNFNTIANIQEDLGKSGEAGKAYLSAIQEQEAIVQIFPNDIDLRRELVRFRINYAQHLHRRSDAAGARDVFKRTSDECKRLAESKPDIVGYRSEWARCVAARYQFEMVDLFHRNQLAELYKLLPEIEQAYRACLAAQEEALQHEPRSVVYRTLAAMHLRQLADALATTGALAPRKLAEADTLLERSVQMQRELAEETPGAPENRSNLASYLVQRGGVLGRVGKGDAADKLYAEAISVVQALVQQCPNAQKYKSQLGTTWLLKGLDGRRRGRDPKELSQEFAQSIDALQKAVAASALDAQSRMNLGKACINRAEMALNLDDHVGAADAAVLLKETATNPILECVLAARFLARCIALAEKDQQLTDRQKTATAYADQAMAALKAAYDAGFKDTERLRGYDELAPLHQREDYQKLMKAMGKSG